MDISLGREPGWLVGRLLMKDDSRIQSNPNNTITVSKRGERRRGGGAGCSDLFKQERYFGPKLRPGTTLATRYHRPPANVSSRAALCRPLPD